MFNISCVIKNPTFFDHLAVSRRTLLNNGSLDAKLDLLHSRGYSANPDFPNQRDRLQVALESPPGATRGGGHQRAAEAAHAPAGDAQVRVARARPAGTASRVTGQSRSSPRAERPSWPCRAPCCPPPREGTPPGRSQDSCHQPPPMPAPRPARGHQHRRTRGRKGRPPRSPSPRGPRRSLPTGGRGAEPPCRAMKRRPARPSASCRPWTRGGRRPGG